MPGDPRPWERPARDVAPSRSLGCALVLVIALAIIVVSVIFGFSTGNLIVGAVVGIVLDAVVVRLVVANQRPRRNPPRDLL